MSSIVLHHPAADAVEPGTLEKTSASLHECAFWLRVGFVGASLCGIGLAGLFQSQIPLAMSAPLAVAGVTLASFSWRHARGLLDPSGEFA